MSQRGIMSFLQVFVFHLCLLHILHELSSLVNFTKICIRETKCKTTINCKQYTCFDWKRITDHAYPVAHVQLRPWVSPFRRTNVAQIAEKHKAGHDKKVLGCVAADWLECQFRPLSTAESI